MRLPIVTIGNVRYYFDRRLRQLREVDNPHAFVEVRETDDERLDLYLKAKAQVGAAEGVKKSPGVVVDAEKFIATFESELDLPVVVAEVLCSSGEVPFQIEDGASLKSILDQGARALDGAYCNNVVVVRGKDGKFYVGEFSFTFEEVTEEQARATAEDFGADCDDVEPDDQR